MNSDKLVQFLKNYLDLEGVELLIVIQTHIAQKWLYKLTYKYKDIHKDVFINGYEQSDITKDCKVFLNKIEELKPYIVEFDEDDAIKSKVYFSDFVVGSNN